MYWVLMHGWGFDKQVFADFIEQHLPTGQGIAVDLPGFGDQPFLPYAEYFDQLLAKLPDEFGLLGWSLGGLYAQRLALYAPQRVKRLVQLTSSPCFIANNDWPGIRSAIFDQFHQRLAIDPIRVRHEFIALQARGAVMPKASQEPSLASLQQGMQLLLNWDLRPSLSLLSMPVDYVFGRLDAIIPVQLHGLMQSQYPQFNYHCIRQSAHMPFISHPLIIQEILQSTAE